MAWQNKAIIAYVASVPCHTGISDGDRDTPLFAEERADNRPPSRLRLARAPAASKAVDRCDSSDYVCIDAQRAMIVDEFQEKFYQEKIAARNAWMTVNNGTFARMRGDFFSRLLGVVYTAGSKQKQKKTH